jgi:hypothetical protein
MGFNALPQLLQNLAPAIFSLLFLVSGIVEAGLLLIETKI